ncbi:hypothetical protein I4U23_011893 [Adineta vaga]|nr:hypothetical protein I4U23_011893 [Adineta vaga]
MNENNNNDEEDGEFPFVDLFGLMEKIFVDFDDEFSSYNRYGDENLNSIIENHSLSGTFSPTFSSSSTITSMHRKTTP